MTAVQANNLWKYYGDYPALRQISFQLETGQCLALLGRNGAGKTTLLRILAGLSRPQQGILRVLGRESRDPNSRASIGILGHGIALYEELSALENLKLFASLYGVADPEDRARRWLERTGLDTVSDSLVREFSRGMRQRLAIARAFLHEPVLLLLDEPFTSLDDRAIKLLQGLLGEALARRSTVILSTHQLREAMELSTHVALLHRGQLTFYGERPAEMLSDPTWLYRTHGES
ncbi:MAG: heme ABC exporter ATP-binding protein CcmA [Bryobacteraceae bacterium]|nr:heme ABC exporter ATP-binding protein CcmA [Bryobacteraceae bacterium]MDW8379718.1 heme ABC exporter ATP-binding protein CcmA [Bryobacterales bacterium]